jgi:hypothetical protein
MASIAQMPAFKDGDGGGDGPFDWRDVALQVLTEDNAELRACLRRLIDSDGEEATEAIAEADRLLSKYDAIDAEDEGAVELERFMNSPNCDCGAFKGIGSSYCPDCDKEAMESLGLRRIGEPLPANDSCPQPA